MKNLLYLIDKLEDLPIDTLSLYLRKKHLNGLAPYYTWNRKRHTDWEGKVGNMSMYSYTLMVIDNNIGKSFDMAFSYFCSKVPKNCQHIFLSYFRGYHYRGYDYYIDENGLIQENVYKKWVKKRNLTYRSDDFQQVWQHKVLKNIVEKDWKGDPKIYSWCSHKGCDHHKCSHTKDDYELVTVKGWSKTFERWDDPEFKKLRSIQHRRQMDRIRKDRNKKRGKGASFRILVMRGVDQREKAQKKWEQEEKWRKDREESILNRMIKEEEANLVKIIAHGFDPVYSFRGLKRKKDYE